jgi:hypothetical protein
LRACASTGNRTGHGTGRNGCAYPRRSGWQTQNCLTGRRTTGQASRNIQRGTLDRMRSAKLLLVLIYSVPRSLEGLPSSWLTLVAGKKVSYVLDRSLFHPGYVRGLPH